MENAKDIIKVIEEFAPPNLACSWDNSGWQVNIGSGKVNDVLLCLTCTNDVIDQAIDNECELIISHHPLIFNKFNSIDTSKNCSQVPLVRAIREDISVYSAHTNLDSCKGGIADKMASMLDLQDVRNIECLGNEAQLGRIGEMWGTYPMTTFLNILSETFNVKDIMLTNPYDFLGVKTVAVVPGAGGSLIPKLYVEDIDILVTGDVRYHNALEAHTFAVADIGHFESERIILPVLKDLLKDLNINIIIAEEKSPWKVC